MKRRLCPNHGSGSRAGTTGAWSAAGAGGYCAVARTSCMSASVLARLKLVSAESVSLPAADTSALPLNTLSTSALQAQATCGVQKAYAWRVLRPGHWHTLDAVQGACVVLASPPARTAGAPDEAVHRAHVPLYRVEWHALRRGHKVAGL